MRRKASGPRALSLFWVACLLAPPVTSVWLDRVQPVAPAPDATAPNAVELTARLRMAEEDLRALDVTLAREEFEPVLTRVLAPDPATHRHALWVGIRGTKPVPTDITALTADHQLLGRVVDVVSPPLGCRVAQIQSLRDRAFRVRFVAGETSGLAAGTGALTEDGHPLLEILFLNDPRKLEDGERVYTDASDGVFAPGIPIGTIERDIHSSIEERRNRLPVIRTELVVDRRGRFVLYHGRVVLLRDSMRLSAARVTRKPS